MKRDWLQLIANAGVIVGLMVLIYEVNQSNVFAQAENASASSSFAVDRETAVMGENVGLVLAKAIDDPDALTTHDLIVVDAYHRQLLMELINQAYQADLGVFSSDWENEWGQYIRLHFDYPFGRKWWSHQRVRMTEEPAAQAARAVVDRALSASTNERGEFFRLLKSEA
jgi:hypothetical protein